jgi:3-oxoacyl-[acyl-carrier protein] reductase
VLSIDLTASAVLVTGSGGGIGYAIARRFLEAGATVIAHSRRESEGLAVLARQFDRLRLVTGELTDESFVESMFAPDAQHPPIDILINNAGSFPSRPILQTSPAEFGDVVSANAGITFTCLLYAARSMRETGGGSIVNIASLNASHPGPDQSAYNSAKAAVVGLTRSAASELAASNIRVNAVSPGLVDRPGLADDWPEGVAAWRARSPLGRLGRAEDVADACVFLSSSMASWITGQELMLDGGISSNAAY